MRQMWSLLLIILPCTFVVGQNQQYQQFYSDNYSEAPRPVYLGPSSTTEENLGPLYLAAMVNQLSTERYKIMGPTPVPPTKTKSDVTYSPAPLKGVLEALYDQAAESYLQRPPETENSVFPDSPNGEHNGAEDDTFYWDVPGGEGHGDTNEMEMSTEMDGLGEGLQKGHDAAMANPLFAAMASFIGLSTLFAASVLFMPKFGSGRALEGVEQDIGEEVLKALENFMDW